EGLRAAVMRMMAKDPAERWPSVEDVIAAIGSPTLTPDDPTRSQLIAIAKTGQRRAIGVSTPKSPIPLMRTPAPLSSTPRTGAVPIGAADATASGTTESPTDAAAAPLTIVRRHSSPLSLALAGGGLLVALVAISVALRSRSAPASSAPSETGAAAAVAPAPAPPVAAPAPVVSQDVSEPAIAESRPEPKPAGGKKTAPAKNTGRGSKTKTPVAIPESVAAPAAATVSAESTPAAPKPAPAGAATPGPAVASRTVSGASALLGGGGAAGTVRTGPSAADRKAVEATVRGYAAALDAGSATQARRAFPGMPNAQQTYLESFFGSGGHVKTDWKVSDIAVDGDHASARVRGTTRSTPGGGNPALDPVDAKVTLERAT